MQDGKRVRESLETRDLERAVGKFAQRQNSASDRPRRKLSDAIGAFEQQHSDAASETVPEVPEGPPVPGRVLRRGRRRPDADQVSLELLDSYALKRRKANWTWLKEIEILRQFFAFCQKRKWSEENPTEGLKRPQIEQREDDIVPYTPDDVAKILAACNAIGRASYERRRARAMVLLMRFAGLRISDVVTLSREHTVGRYLIKKLIKNHKTVRVEIPDVVLAGARSLAATEGGAERYQVLFCERHSESAKPCKRRGADTGCCI